MLWLKSFSELSSIHGMKWHLYVHHFTLKVVFVAFILVTCVAVPTFFIYEAVDFFSQVSRQPLA